MIETTIPEINVLELMERVRAKAEEIRRLQARPKLPPVAEVQLPPAAVLPGAVVPKTQQIIAAIDDARRAVKVPRWIPKPLRVFFRRHDHFDRDVLRSIDSLAHTNAQLADRLRHLSACVEVQDHAIQHLAELRRLDGNWMRAIGDITITANERLTELRAALHTEIDTRFDGHRRAAEERLAAALQQINELQRACAALNEITSLRQDLASVSSLAAGCRNDIDRAGEHLRNLQNQVDVAGAVAGGCRKDLDRAGEHLRNLQAHVDVIAAEATPLRSSLDVLSGQFAVIRDEMSRAGEHLRNLQNLFDQHASTAPLKAALSQLDERLTADTSFLKGELSLQRNTLAQLLSSKRNVATRRTRDGAAEPAAALLDAFYVSFEDRFRGSRTSVAERQRVYLPVITNATKVAKELPVVDLGCGRGEWLDLLRSNDVCGEGVDVNPTMVAQCQARGLTVTEKDAITYLKSRKAASAAAVTGFHIIEHLEFSILLQLFAHAYRVLAPGGVVVFESPSCKNLIVGACNFNVDPTHRNPVFPETAEFILNLSGFEDVQLKYLHPVDAELFEGNDRLSSTLNELLYGPQDFAVIGHKAARR